MKHFRMPTAYTILFCLLILTAAATWVIPAGRYERAGEEDTPVAGTPHNLVVLAPGGGGGGGGGFFWGF